MMPFAWPWLLAALPLPWLAARFLPPARPAMPTALRVPFFHYLAGGLPAAPPRSGPPSWLLRLAWLDWGLLVLAAARPHSHGVELYPWPLAAALALSVCLALLRAALTGLHPDTTPRNPP